MLKDAECFTHIYLRTGRTDMRLGNDGLLTVIGGQMGLDPTEPGSVFLFCGRKKNRMKALIFEGDGWLLCYKRLTGDCSYQWPRDENEARELTNSWHIIDSKKGAKASAFLYSIAETAKANGLNPFEYFKFLMEQLKEYPRNDVPEEDLKKLMPWSETLPDCCKQRKKQLTMPSDFRWHSFLVSAGYLPDTDRKDRAAGKRQVSGK